MPKDKAKIKGKLVVYIGFDDGYFDTLKARFAKQFPQSEFTYHQIRPKRKEHYQKIFALVARAQPQIIYIDFSYHRLAQLKIAQLLTRDNATKQIPTVGLVETKANIRECISSGVTFTHVKCGEYYDVVYDPFSWAFPKETAAPNFARAKFKRAAQLINDFRIGYITKDSIRAEGDLPLSVGEKVRLESSIPSSNIPSKYFVVKSVSESNLYYDFRYGYELDFVFVDEPETEDDSVEKALGEPDAKKREKALEEAAKKSNQAEKQYHEDILIAKTKHQAWLKERLSESQAKKTKIMIVDPGLKVFEEDKLIESYPFTIRAQSFLSEDMAELERLRPHLIAFQFIRHDLFEQDKVDIFEATSSLFEEKKPSQNEEDEDEVELSLEEKEAREKIINEEKEISRTKLLRLVNKIKSIENYQPFIVVFNSFDYTSTTLKDNFKYSLMLSNKGHVNLKTVCELAEVYERKQERLFDEKAQKKVESLKASEPAKYKYLTVDDLKEEQFFIPKDDPLSFAAYSYPVELDSMTESEMTFLIDMEIDHTVLRFDTPVPMTITLVPNQDKKYQKEGNLYQYKALIHSVDEDDKKDMRKAINEIFFDPINRQREKEAEEFKNIHDKALREREESKKKNKESAENDKEASPDEGPTKDSQD